MVIRFAKKHRKSNIRQIILESKHIKDIQPLLVQRLEEVKTLERFLWMIENLIILRTCTQRPENIHHWIFN